MRLDRVRSIASNNLVQTSLTPTSRCHLGIHIAPSLPGGAYIAIEQLQHFGIDNPPLCQLEWWDNEPLLVQFTRHRHRPRRHATDVGMMRSAGDKAKQFARASIGIIGNKDG